ncbi:MAG TPA: anthrone oxygenase family protein [Phenylobacterium sp.]|jgi:hypothetical protein|uniref:anthrone oxygenase family protein n=1 Tax=Phenylobacterium sp. TaxID=1871053 RepID=UPI002D33756F|nr:anthrone oxygenase family protein [Phenylobacterium sp.]HZZ67853.1 anthrone oxygenase family protein [Phenylobacterium sp.]
MRLLRILALALAVAATLTPLAHVLELPNKLRLDGALWLAVQQHLYNGWGPFIGGPAEIGGLLVSLALLVAPRSGPVRLLHLASALCYVAMLLCFFLLNDPVNQALRDWTPAALPGDWRNYRLKWEVGHALAAVFAILALTTTVFAGTRRRAAP